MTTPDHGPPSRRLPEQFLCFGIVGAGGLVVDVAVLHLALAQGLDLYGGRALSYLVAATATWYGNRQLTFRDRRSPRLPAEWLRFLVVNLPGGMINYGVYALLVTQLPLFAAWPGLAVAAGSLCGMIANFLGSRRLAFVHRG